MRQVRVKWIRKVVVSKDPKILEMVIERIGEKRAENLTYNQIIQLCKKMWKEHVPGVKEWKIYKEVAKGNV